MPACIERQAFLVQGQVQGVGFRPFVWRLAQAEKLTGSARNTAAGVRIEVQGNSSAIKSFARRLERELPVLAKITSLSSFALPLKKGEEDFVIAGSEEGGGTAVLVSPDMSVCEECLLDVRDPANRRCGYAFANCTNCGPRFSITRKLPYDRPFTTMACFELCAACAAEYANPADRRFHAQPIACAACGPKVWFARQAAGGNTRGDKDDAEAVAKAGQALLAGQIVALRGLGGFQLACDARNSAAVAKLRQRKQRPHKALAVMMRNLAAARAICRIGTEQEKLLTGNRKPIVLCRRKSRGADGLAPELCPDVLDLGVMLPYTPLHALLFDWLARESCSEPVLVMTSANPKGEPICLGNREALARIGHLADAWLLHDRDILCRVDDSVVAVHDGMPVFLRRARGYVPEPVALGFEAPPILATGAFLKNAFCLTRGDKAFLSQHIGDLDAPACMEFYEEALAHLQALLAVAPCAVAHDLHPDFASTNFGRGFAARHGIPAIGVQHHLAHAAACLGENACIGPALALCLDGSGLGTDGEIWGGELLYVDLQNAEWRRLGSLAHFPLPGGEAAISEPWRVAAGLSLLAGEDIASRSSKHAALAEMIARGVNTPWTSSCGRLFDAVASCLELCDVVSYEGQAAIRLETAALQWQAATGQKEPEFAPMPLTETNGMPQLDSTAIFAQATALQDAGFSVPAIAFAFHKSLAANFAQLAAMQAERLNLKHVALCGGAMQNSLFLRFLPEYLRALGLNPLLNRRIPPGDGGIAYGQALWCARSLAG